MSLESEALSADEFSLLDLFGPEASPRAQAIVQAGAKRSMDEMAIVLNEAKANDSASFSTADNNQTTQEVLHEAVLELLHLDPVERATLNAVIPDSAPGHRSKGRERLLNLASGKAEGLWTSENMFIHSDAVMFVKGFGAPKARPAAIIKNTTAAGRARDQSAVIAMYMQKLEKVLVEASRNGVNLATAKLSFVADNPVTKRREEKIIAGSQPRMSPPMDFRRTKQTSSTRRAKHSSGRPTLHKSK
ncbi:hypothetical protein QM543_10075 [Pantoea eucrina]|uniref:hypothetical protein n=1 Tax=Pantoea eucrina TaxID=472693 RepID=UPI0024B765FC|nr:hypothetical protein [Pantoea eucrina]MDJ0023631.1 hypothetical protein [Pantoea eucrina]